jgi:hypothetical protein
MPTGMRPCTASRMAIRQHRISHAASTMPVDEWTTVTLRMHV